jgi:hypothetical protein
MIEKKPQMDLLASLHSERQTLEDEVQAMIQFSEDHHEHIDQMVAQVREFKEKQRKNE